MTLAISSKPIAAAIILATAALAAAPIISAPEDVVGGGLALALIPMVVMLTSNATVRARIIVPIAVLLAVTFFVYIGRGIIPLGR